ncbi:hypothetical protein Y032_0049g1849 [Ancylostoma ceylanicum]|uniref:Uncharacterized protein n=1 Tax=Ancylostoma ceylanicum TaxID=53326 RepID=A0A016UAP2_9BILA|nr:hypothetical protein Y032_0049g1849 [Ancylostoma ceylanicum]
MRNPGKKQSVRSKAFRLKRNLTDGVFPGIGWEFDYWKTNVLLMSREEFQPLHGFLPIKRLVVLSSKSEPNIASNFSLQPYNFQITCSSELGSATSLPDQAQPAEFVTNTG